MNTLGKIITQEPGRLWKTHVFEDAGDVFIQVGPAEPRAPLATLMVSPASYGMLGRVFTRLSQNGSTEPAPVLRLVSSATGK